MRVLACLSRSPGRVLIGDGGDFVAICISHTGQAAEGQVIYVERPAYNRPRRPRRGHFDVNGPALARQQDRKSPRLPSQRLPALEVTAGSNASVTADRVAEAASVGMPLGRVWPYLIGI